MRLSRVRGAVNPSAPMIALDRVCRRYDTVTAVDHVSLDIMRGAFVALVGASGSGKSTLLRMINRLVDPTSGSIRFGDLEISGLHGAALRNWQRDCAMIFQQFNLVPRMDVASNVLHGILNRRSTLQTMFNLWPRADILRAFMNRQMPQISVTCEVDVTEIRRGCEAAGVSFFLGMSHAVSRAVHAVPQFRHRVIDGTLCEYDRTDPGYTVAREGDLFSFCDGLYLEDFQAYCQEARTRMAAVKATPGAIGYASSDHVLRDGLSGVKLRNRRGEWMEPTTRSFKAAIVAGGLFKHSLEPASLLDLDGVGVWPIVTATYVLVPREPASLERAGRTLNFFYRSFLMGDKAVAGTGFAPLPIATQARIVTLLSGFRTTKGEQVPVIGSGEAATTVAAR